jgi:hypothetical protein
MALLFESIDFLLAGLREKMFSALQQVETDSRYVLGESI